jgi:predicted dithiol-disulfide oxidoreductase (DUF899 family)
MAGEQMPTIDVVSAADWAAARAKLRTLETQEASARQAVNAARRRMPAVRVDKQYAFDGPAGRVTLADLFEGRPQLIVYHFMFLPGWSAGCPYCSHIIDSVGHLAHPNALGTTLAAVSRAPQSKIGPFRDRMGWQIPWYSAVGTDFNDDFQATDERGALTVFLRDQDAIYHTYSAHDEEIDLHILDSTYLDLTPLGLPPGQPWPQHHDRYRR